MPVKKRKKHAERFNLTSTDEVVTYTARGLEPYRGFEQFYHSIPFILKARPNASVIIMGSDRAYYGANSTSGHAAQMKREFPLDSSRVHFLEFSSYDNYRALLQLSSVHV